MKQVTVGINRNRIKAAVAGISDSSGQIRMQRGLTAQKYDIGGGTAWGKFIQPGFDGNKG